MQKLIDTQSDSSYDGKCCPIKTSELICSSQEAAREGYFGTICKALWSTASGVDVVVAVKRRNTLQCNNWDMARFGTLIQQSASLRHPNCIRLLGFDNIGDDLFVAMEWVQNGSIADALETGDNVPPHVRLRMAREIAEGLAHLHEQNVIHGSIKNRNILMAQDGTTKLGDRIFT